MYWYQAKNWTQKGFPKTRDMEFRRYWQDLTPQKKRDRKRGQNSEADAKWSSQPLSPASFIEFPFPSPGWENMAREIKNEMDSVGNKKVKVHATVSLPALYMERFADELRKRKDCYTPDA